MTHAQLTDNVRQLVVQAFAELGVAQPDQYRESILLHGGNYCGRRFDGQGAHAVWFVEENQVKVMAGDGGLVQVIAADRQPLLPVRRAA